MRQHYQIVGDGVGILSGGHCYRLRLIPILGCERQFRLVHRNVCVHWHLHGHGHVRRRLRGQYYRVAGAVALVYGQRCRGRDCAAHVVVGDHAYCPTICDCRVGSIDQHEPQCLCHFVYIVVDDGHADRLLCLQGGEGQRAGRSLVIPPLRRRAGRGRIIYCHRLIANQVQPHRKRYHPVAFGCPCVGDRQRWRIVFKDCHCNAGRGHCVVVAATDCMRQHYCIVSYCIGILRCGHCYCLRLLPILVRERQFCLVYCDLRVLWHLHGHGHVRCRLRVQYYHVAVAVALANHQCRRGHTHSKYVIVDDLYRRAGCLAYPMGRATGDRCRHCAVRLVALVVVCRHHKRGRCCIRRECSLGRCSVGEKRAAIRYPYRHRQRHGQVADARQRERYRLAFYHFC